MKTRRKFVAFAMAAVSLFSLTPMGAGATYDPCDVNHDGSVDMTDLIAINHHLLGSKYYTNYDQLDANRSHTVDKADATCVMSKLTQTTYSACYIRQYANAYMEVVDMPAVSSTITLDESVNQTNSRSYIGYSYLEDEPIPEYTLTATTANLNSTQNTRSNIGLIDGIDDRHIAHGYENTGIVELFMFAEGNRLLYSTGFIVGDHEIVTAAHCVTDDNTILQDITISTYDRTGLKDGGKLTVAEIHIPAEYTDPCSEYDYALITVVEDLSDRVQFSIGNSYNMTNSEVGTIPIHVTGRPGMTGDNLDIYNSTGALYTHYGSVYGPSNRTLLHYTVDVSRGQSGAPTYTITRERYNNTDYYTYTALAVHTGGNSNRNVGTLMTKYHLQFFRNNPYANYQ